MLTRRVPRVFAAGILLALAVPALAACRTSPAVAAYVGDQQVSVAQLDTAVAAREADPAIAKYAAGKEADFTRRVLTLLVQEDVYAAAADHFGVQVADSDVRARIAELLGNDDPNTVYAQLAAQGISREDVFENVRQQLVRQRIAAAQGKGGGTSEAELRARYDQLRPSLAKIRFGYITVPDQATADAVLAQLTADPAAYPAVAARYPGSYTLPAVQARAAADIPGPIADAVTKAQPNTGFTLPLQEVGGVIVGFVVGTEYPTFEEERPALEKAAGDAAETAAAKVVSGFQKSLHVTVNPRYGALKNGQLAADSGGVVHLLDQAAATSAPSAGGN